ncbi:transposase [Pirellulimonas nuda]|nr:transposase [Pirellulimonas nuda]
MPRKKPQPAKSGRRVFTPEFKQEAVQMLLDGHKASSVAERLGVSHANVLYRWKRELLAESGPVAGALETRVHELEVERERDVLKKSVDYFRPQRITEVYAAMEAIVAANAASALEACGVLGVSRSAYYAWRRA